MSLLKKTMEAERHAPDRKLWQQISKFKKHLPKSYPSAKLTQQSPLFAISSTSNQLLYKQHHVFTVRFRRTFLNKYSVIFCPFYAFETKYHVYMIKESPYLYSKKKNNNFSQTLQFSTFQLPYHSWPH